MPRQDDIPIYLLCSIFPSDNGTVKFLVDHYFSYIFLKIPENVCAATVTMEPGTGGHRKTRRGKKTTLAGTERSRSSLTQYLPVPKAHRGGPAAYQMSRPDGGHCTKCPGRNRDCTRKHCGQRCNTDHRCPRHQGSSLTRGGATAGSPHQTSRRRGRVLEGFPTLDPYMQCGPDVASCRTTRPPKETIQGVPTPILPGVYPPVLTLCGARGSRTVNYVLCALSRS
eukprot:GHVU01015998.1.p1 GENE.GHVU01015998.1~~GHVU01015998.1.p1  ORF type:complete len:225 (+),score=0.40 GHVU01015998.1:65-739(+)